MSINKIHSQNIYSLRQAINMTALQKSMNQGNNMLTLIDDMAETVQETKAISHPYKGTRIDIFL